MFVSRFLAYRPRRKTFQRQLRGDENPNDLRGTSFRPAGQVAAAHTDQPRLCSAKNFEGAETRAWKARGTSCVSASSRSRSWSDLMAHVARASALYAEGQCI